MRVIAFNGSPRKNWNTHILLEKALEGARDQGGETELYHLFDLKYSGCRSCFACSGPTTVCTGKCVVRDDIQPILHNIDDDTALIFGSPIYFGDVTGAMRNFLERLMFQYHNIGYDRTVFFKKPVKTAMIYTMGATEEEAEERGQTPLFLMNRHCLEMVFGTHEYMVSYDTYQHEDYTRFYTLPGVVERKTERRKTQFIKDLEKAYDIGARFAR